MKKNAATNLRAMLGVKKDSKPAVHVSPAQQAKLDEEAEWLKTGQFDRLGKIMEDRRRREQDLANQNFGDFFKYWEGLKQGHPGIRIGTMHTITGRLNCGKSCIEEVERHVIGRPRGVHLDEADNFDIDMDFSKLENRVMNLQIFKGSRPGMQTIALDYEAGCLHATLGGVQLHEEFDTITKKLRNAYRCGDCGLTHNFIGAIRCIYKLANEPGGNPVLAERIAVWWEEHKEAYSLPAEITL